MNLDSKTAGVGRLSHSYPVWVKSGFLRAWIRSESYNDDDGHEEISYAREISMDKRGRYFIDDQHQVLVLPNDNGTAFQVSITF